LTNNNSNKNNSNSPHRGTNEKIKRNIQNGAVQRQRTKIDVEKPQENKKMQKNTHQKPENRKGNREGTFFAEKHWVQRKASLIFEGWFHVA